MRFGWMIGFLLLAGCSMFSSKSGGSSTLTLNNPYWDQVNVEIVLTRSSDCENRDGYISTAQILMRKNKTEAVDVPSGANVCWRHDRNPNNPVAGAWSGWTKATLFPGQSGEAEIWGSVGIGTRASRPHASRRPAVLTRQDPVYARPAHAVSCRQALKTRPI